MAVIENLSEDEAYLYAILSDISGLDQAEFFWTDMEDEDYCFRARPYQWKWWRDDSDRQIDMAGRSVGKSLSIKVRAFAFPFIFSGEEMVITAPEGVHLDAITDVIETSFYSTRIGNELLVKGRGGVKHRPFHVNFANGSRIMGRIPQRDGRGVKGVHPIWLELDEAQDYPDKGWIELVETVKRGSEGAVWRCHGVTRGVRDYFYKFTQPESGWRVHRLCLPSDTLIYGINGPVRIEDVEIGTDVYSVEPCSNGIPRLTTGTITNKRCNGIQPIWTIVTRDRELSGTWNHPVMVLKDSTKRKRRKIEIEWRELSRIKTGDYIVAFVKGFNNEGEVSSSLGAEMHNLSPLRTIPEYIWKSSRNVQMAFLNGYLIADGSLSRQKRGQDALAVSASSRELVRGLRVLAQYLGYRTTKVRFEKSYKPSGEPSCGMYRFYIYELPADFRQFPSECTTHDLVMDEHLAIRKVLSSNADNSEALTWDIEVGDKHNFIAEGIVTHNTAMHRPDWTDEERQQKIEEYGSKENPDYRRNVLGLHGDATSPLFVLHRLMATVDTDESSEYNEHEYTKLKINHEMVMDENGDIRNLLDFPRSHLSYKTTWIGMDVGFTNDPSEIVIFAETHPKKDQPSVLKLLSRVQLQRVSGPDQVVAILWLMDFYKPKAFALDRTGVGLPLYQQIQHDAESDPVLRKALDTIKGYNFSEKILVDFDASMETEDPLKDAGMWKNVAEHSYDKLREVVDQKRIFLPFDKDLIGEFQGQTFSYNRSGMDMYGRRRTFSAGSFHALDACRMAVLVWSQNTIETLKKNYEEQKRFKPITEVFFA